MGLFSNFNALQIFHSAFFGLFTRLFASSAWRKGEVVKNAEMGEQVELLEHHTNFAPDMFDVLELVGQLNAFTENLPLLMLLQSIDATDRGEQFSLSAMAPLPFRHFRRAVMVSPVGVVRTSAPVASMEKPMTVGSRDNSSASCSISAGGQAIIVAPA